MDFSSERVLIAGCGDLGQRVAHRLAAAGASVWALRRHPGTQEVPWQWLRGDLAKPGTWSLPERITRVVFSPAPDARDEPSYRAVFIDGLHHLMASLDHDACHRILFVSSSAVYGEHAGGWVDEDTPAKPMGFNGRVLLEAERWLAAQPVSSVALRLAGLYGPGRTQLIERLREGRARVPRLVGHWSNRIHVDDAASAIVHLLMQGPVAPVYIGADDTPLPLAELYDYLAGLIGVPLPEAGPAPPGVGSKRLDNARLRASGFRLAWPDSRQGYAALIRP